MITYPNYFVPLNCNYVPTSRDVIAYIYLSVIYLPTLPITYQLHTYISSYKPTCIHAYIHTYMHTYIHIHGRTLLEYISRTYTPVLPHTRVPAQCVARTHTVCDAHSHTVTFAHSYTLQTYIYISQIHFTHCYPALEVKCSDLYASNVISRYVTTFYLYSPLGGI